MMTVAMMKKKLKMPIKVKHVIDKSNMKISELINKLQEIQAEKGDLYVWVNSLDIEKN